MAHKFVQTFMVVRRWILLTLVILWPFLWQHQEVDICGFKCLHMSFGWIAINWTHLLQTHGSAIVSPKSCWCPLLSLHDWIVSLTLVYALCFSADKKSFKNYHSDKSYICVNLFKWVFYRMSHVEDHKLAKWSCCVILPHKTNNMYIHLDSCLTFTIKTSVFPVQCIITKLPARPLPYRVVNVLNKHTYMTS